MQSSEAKSAEERCGLAENRMSLEDFRIEARGIFRIPGNLLVLRLLPNPAVVVSRHELWQVPAASVLD